MKPADLLNIILHVIDCSKTTTQLIKGELRSVFVILFLVLVTAFQSDNVYMDLQRNIFFYTFVSLVNSQIASVLTGLNQLN